MREYQGVKMSWVELDRIVSGEIVHDDGIRRRVAESGRPLRSHATGMSDDDLLAKLRGLGVDADREKLAGLCDGALSAEEVVSERLRLHDWDADWAWICLTELWQRWWPEKACLELLDDKVQEGYDADQRNDFVASGRIWLGAWSDVLRMCDAIGARSIRDFDDRFPMTQSLFNWCQDLEMALQNGGEHDSELRTARLEMAAAWLRRFPTEDALTTGNFRRALGRLLFRDRASAEGGRVVPVVAGRRSRLGMGMDRLGRLLHALRSRQDTGLRAGGRDPAPWLRGYPGYGKPSTSRNGWRTSAAGPAVPPRPRSSGSRRKRTGSVPGGG